MQPFFIPVNGKVPVLKGWQSRGEATPSELESWTSAGYNIGVLARRYPALDLDVASEEVRDAVLGVLPHTWVRHSKPPRLLVMFDLDGEPIRKRKATVIDDLAGLEHTVELLCDGQQYVIRGRHPNGYDYALENESYPLYKVTTEELCELWDEVVEALKGCGDLKKETRLTGQGGTAKPMEAPSREDLERVVAAMANDIDDRDEWVRVLSAIRGAGGEDAEDLAVEWSLQWGGEEEEARRVFQSLDNPKLGWLDLCNMAGASPFGVQEVQDVSEAEPGTIQFTDDWIAMKLLPYVGGMVLWDPNGREWMVWDGRVWKKDRGEHPVVIRDQLRYLALAWNKHGAPMGKEDPGWCKTAGRSLSQAGVRNAREALKEMVPVHPDDFDKAPMLLNTPEGVVNLKDGEAGAHDHSLLMRRMTACSARPMRTPVFDAFMYDLTEGDMEMADFLRRWAGYCLTGHMHEKAMLYCVGSLPDTGKSQFVGILQGVMGSYADSVDIKTLLKTDNKVVYNLARLPGVRLVTATEPQQGATWDDSLIKAVTGGDRTEVRQIRGKPFVYAPSWKLLVAGNNQPNVDSGDTAMLRRVMVSQMNNQIPRERQIPELARKIVEKEGPGVLSWALGGCLEWQQGGLNPPKAITEATSRYSEDADVLGLWLESHCNTGDDHEAATCDLYESWKKFCDQAGEYPGSQRMFSLRIQAKGFEYAKNVTRGNGKYARGYKGVSLDPFRKVMT